MKQWRYLFHSHILERGLNYYEEGCVTSLKQTQKGYRAVVEGTEAYDVEIEIYEGQVQNMTCTCPYATDRNHCKHMAAVLYEIEEENLDGKISVDDAQNQEERLKDIIEKIPLEDLKEMIFSLASSDNFLYNKIMTKYAPITSHQIVRLKRQVSDIGYQYSNRSGFVDYYHVEDYIDALNTFLNENIPFLLEKKCRMEAFELVNCIFYEMGKRDIDDSDGVLSFAVEICYKYWKMILQECDEKEKENMFQWFQSHQKNYVIDYMEYYISEFLINEFHDERMLRENLHMLDEQIDKMQKENYREEYRVYYNLVNNISARIHIMKELDYSKAEIREYQKKYKKFSEIRKMEVEEYLSEKKYEEAIAILKESKILDRDKVGLVAEYSQQLIHIYEKRNMQKEYGEELRYQVFECMQRNLDYIIKLKKLCCETEWEEQREKFLKSQTSSWVRYEFLVEEELFGRMIMEIKRNNSIHVLDQYEKVLKKYFPSEVRDLYIQYVKNRATRTLDRKAYKYLIYYLKKIKKYPDGKRISQEIADCWKRDYRRRTAMMDELEKAGF